MMSDEIALRALSYDSKRETVSFQFGGVRNGSSALISGSMRVRTEGDLRESEVRALTSAEVKKLLLDAAALL